MQAMNTVPSASLQSRTNGNKVLIAKQSYQRKDAHCMCAAREKKKSLQLQSRLNFDKRIAQKLDTKARMTHSNTPS